MTNSKECEHTDRWSPIEHKDNHCPNYKMGNHYDDRNINGFICGCEDDCYKHKGAMTSSKKDSELENELVSLLHECDHEPDEITKFVVIDQSEFVPKALQAIKRITKEESDRRVLEMIGEDEPEFHDSICTITPCRCAVRERAEYTRNQFRAELRELLNGDKDV